MDRVLLEEGQRFEESNMNLRCTFHVSPASTKTPTAEVRPRMPSLLDVDIDWVDEPAPRGRSSETWQRARGWSSED